MRFSGMRLIHFVEGGQQVVQVFALCGVAEHPFEGLAVRLHTRRQPQRGTAEVCGHIGRAVLETAAREFARGQRHGAEIIVRRRPREARGRVGEECGYDRCDRTRQSRRWWHCVSRSTDGSFRCFSGRFRMASWGSRAADKHVIASWRVRGDSHRSQSHLRTLCEYLENAEPNNDCITLSSGTI